MLFVWLLEAVKSTSGIYIVDVLVVVPLSGFSRRQDYKVGEISYHMYLLHCLVAAVSAQPLFSAIEFLLDHWFALLTILVTSIISLFITRFVDEPMGRLRNRTHEGPKVINEHQK